MLRSNHWIKTMRGVTVGHPVRMAALTRRQFAALAAALGGAGVAGAAAQPVAAYPAEDLAHAQALRELALRDTQAYALVESLVTEVGARAAGSPGDARAVQWALAQFKRLGLANARAEAVPLRVWQRGPAQAQLIEPYPHPLVMIALGNSVGTPPGGLQAELAYYPDLQALKADQSERPRGRLVFIDEKTERTRDGSGYGRAVLARSAGAVEAARRGAVAVAIRSIGTDRDRIAHTGAMRYDAQVAQIPAFAVSVPDADLIARLHARGQVPRIQVSLQSQSGVAATTHNVIAEVPGTDLADQVVLLGAHLDSWDVGQGALDDGAGVGIVTAAARVLLQAGRRPRRTVRVVLFGNEENGFDGANAYGERYKGVTHQLLGESDFGAGRIWRLRGRVRPEALPFIAAMGRVLEPLGVEWSDGPELNQGSPAPDAGVLMRRHGWPAMALTQDGSNYFDVHHTDNDTLDKVDAQQLPQNVAAWAVVAWLAAQAPLDFGPLPAA
jgi:carboxypeptidase Q